LASATGVVFALERALYHPSLAAPFRFLDELGHPAGVSVRSVEREAKIHKQPVF
jgi:hypothetical protein